MGGLLRLTALLLIICCGSVMLVSWVGRALPESTGPFYVFDIFSMEEDVFHSYLMDMQRDISIDMTGNQCLVSRDMSAPPNNQRVVEQDGDSIYIVNIVNDPPGGERCKL